MVLLDVLMSKRADVTLFTVDHNTPFCPTEIACCKKLADKYGIPYQVVKLPPLPEKVSKEGWWSEKRNKLFKQLPGKVYTAHHLDDAIEWYTMSTMQGQSKIICPINENIYRPLLATSKEKIIEYARTKGIVHLSDPTNSDITFNLRNKVRKLLVPHIKDCFPGIAKTVRKKVLAKLEELKMSEVES